MFIGLKAWDWIVAGFGERQYFGTGTEGGWLSSGGFVYAGRASKMKFWF